MTTRTLAESGVTRIVMPSEPSQDVTDQAFDRIEELTRKLQIERAVVRACRDHVFYCVCAGHRVSFKSISDAIWIARRRARRSIR